MRLLSIGEAARALGVAEATLRRWHRQGKLAPASRTLGGHRRYRHASLLKLFQIEDHPVGKTVCYARVSSHDQSEQLKTQAARLYKHCLDSGFADIEVIADLGRGLNYRKKVCSAC